MNARRDRRKPEQRKGLPPIKLSDRSNSCFTTVHLDKRMKAELEDLAVRLRATEGRWLTLGEAISRACKLAAPHFNPPADLYQIWKDYHFHSSGPGRGRPPKPGSKPRASRQSIKAAKSRADFAD